MCVVRPAGVFALPTTRHRPDGAHTAPGHTYGQRHERVAIRGQASSTEYLFLSSVAGFAENSSWPITYSTVALTCHRRNFSRRQRSEIFEDTTTSCATAVFAFSGGKQHSLLDFPSRGINSRWKKSIRPRLILSSDSWTQHVSPCSLP